MIRTNKQINLEFPDVTACIGTVNKFNPKVIYLSCKWWIRSHKSYNEDFLQKFLDRIKKSVEEKIKKLERFHNCIIFIPIDYLTPLEANEGKYMSFDVYVKQRGESHRIETLKDDLFNLLKNVIDEFTKDYQSHFIQISKQKIKG